MNDFKKIYSVSLKNCRSKSKKVLRENERAYNSLVNKDSEYAKIIKAMQDLHRKVADIYDNAKDDIF
jgi:hypothetical protein